MPFLRTLTALMLVSAAAPVAAQQIVDPASCHPMSPTTQVVVGIIDGPSLGGTLLCLTDANVVLARNGQIMTTPLTSVSRIETRPDAVWDGAVKGAMLPVIFWAILCHECTAAPMLRAAAAYGLIGLTWDSLQANRKTIYAGARAASVGWRFRFSYRTNPDFLI